MTRAYAEPMRVEAIHLAPDRGRPTRSVGSVRAVPGVGLEGDRYASGRGTWGRRGARGPGRDLTLIEAEEVERLALDFGIELAPGESRRNVTTRGVRLNELIGRRFSIGEVVCEGVRLCEPCTYLEDVTGKPLREPLLHRAGLRADIITSGTIAAGDPIVDLGPAPVQQEAGNEAEVHPAAPGD
jgi:MOSC domain-containing protein YiiM